MEREQEALLTLRERIHLMALTELSWHEMQVDVLAAATAAVLVERPRRMCSHVVVAPLVPAMETNAKEELSVVKKAEKLAVISVVRSRACLGRMELAPGTVAVSFPAALACLPTGSVAFLPYQAHPAKHQS